MELRPPGASARVPDVHVHIDRLVLIGVDVRDRSALDAAVRGEMTRLFAERAWDEPPYAGASVERLDAGVVSLDRGTRDDALGVEIGAAVHRGLTR
jgi:hypothetical protein